MIHAEYTQAIEELTDMTAELDAIKAGSFGNGLAVLVEKMQRITETLWPKSPQLKIVLQQTLASIKANDLKKLTRMVGLIYDELERLQDEAKK